MSRSTRIALVAGSNVAGALSLIAVWWLWRLGLISHTPLPLLLGLVVLALPLDLVTRTLVHRNPQSRARTEIRVVTGVVTTTVVIYAAGWGALLTIAYALCVVQLVAQQRNVNWRTAYLWCVVFAVAGETAVQLGWAPSMVDHSLSHASAALGLAALLPVLWVVSGAFAARDVIEDEIRERERVLSVQVGTDALTGLPNRYALHDALRDRAASGRRLLAFVDLNNFKDVNDTFGHDVGDALLIEVARRLQNIVRPDDLIARVGGDEFVVLVSVSDRAPVSADDFVARVRAELAKPWEAIAPYVVNASVGAVEDIDGTDSVDDLLRHADQEMYRRKYGTTADASLEVMTSRALAHHRVAMDGISGTFCVIRAVTEDDAIVDWRIIEANRLLRQYYEPLFGDPVGACCSELPRSEALERLFEVFCGVARTQRRTQITCELPNAYTGPFWGEVIIVPLETDTVAVMIRDVTAHKRARDELESERTLFATLGEGAAAYACVVDPSGEPVYRPPWLTSFLGYTPDELPPPYDLVAPNDRARAASWFTKVVGSSAGAEPAPIVLRFVGKDGTAHACHVSAKNRLDASAVRGIVVSVHDVSAVAEAEARLAAVTENIDDVIAIIDPDGALKWVSAAGERVLGRSRDQIVEGSALELIHPEDRDRVAARLIEVVEGDTESSPIELRLRHADGHYRWFECIGTNKLDDPTLRGVVVSLHDVTERRAAEEALRFSERRNGAIVEAVADAIITVTAEGEVRTFNRAAERIFGVSRDEAVGRHYGRFLPEESTSMLRQALGSSESLNAVDTIACRGDGTTFDARVSISRFAVEDEMYTAVIRDISDHRAVERALRSAASRDELTGFANRRSILEHAEGAFARDPMPPGDIGLMFIDVDHFKLVNDGLGHDVGDEVLKEVGARIASQIRGTDVIARIGGDDFVVLCENIDSIRTIDAIAARIAEVLERPIHVPDGDIFVSASIGVALRQSDDSALDLLRHAETAMYRAKDRGRAQFEVFDSQMHDEVASRLEFESALRHAVESNELEAYYQPIVDLETHSVVHFEALVRWNRPGFGVMRPDTFIPAAEAAGLVVGIGKWMLRRATLDCAQWQTAAPGIGVSVNLSVQHFDAGDVVADVRAALQESELPPELLTLEITETVMLEHTTRNAAIMDTIRSLGVHIALDDFGSGFSSLTYLRRLPIDSLKIDRSFLHSLETDDRDVVMLQAIADLGTTYGVAVVAEGIDTEAKLEAVRAAGCRLGQGFLFSRPVSLDEVMAHIALEHLATRPH